MQEKITNTQLTAGYITTAYVSTAPAWAQNMETWLSLIAVGFGVLVGATTLYLNIKKIISSHRGGKQED